MSASLQTLPIQPGSTETLPGLGSNNSFNQIDKDLSGEFGPALGEAFAALTEPRHGDSGTPPAGNTMADLLQTLPEGGKLLPLLGQALDEATALGIDPQQLLDRIAGKLDGLQTLAGLSPTEQVAAALRQIIQELPAARGGAAEGPAATAATLTRPLGTEIPAGGQAQSPYPSTAQAVAETSGQVISTAARDLLTGKAVPDQAAQRLEQVMMQRVEHNEGKVLKLDGLEQAINRLQAQPQGQAELASMMVAFKRLAAESRQDASLRSDILAAPAATPANAAATTSATSLPSLSLNAPFGQHNWGQAVGERIQWMVSQKMQGAEIKLNPAHLGPMEVRIQVQNDQASVHFTAHHGAVREALEAALPRLRDLFEASGVELVDVDVSGQSFAEQQAMQEEGASGQGGSGGDNNPSAAESESVAVMETPLAGVIGRGALDLFA